MKLYYSVLKYTKSKEETENLNLAILFYCPTAMCKEFLLLTDWKSVSLFDPSIDAVLLKDVIMDIRDEFLRGTTPSLAHFCSRYHSELYFSEIKYAKITTNKTIR